MLAHLLLAAAAASTTGEVPETLSFADARGQQVRLDEPGMLYLVDFVAIGCKPCMIEIPEMEKLAKEFEPTGRFKLVSVLWGDTSGSALETAAKRLETTVPFYSDPENFLERYWSPSFPMKVLIRDGQVLRVQKGGGKGAYHVWSAALKKALKAD